MLSEIRNGVQREETGAKATDVLQGADWFESALVDYDVCSNWGNWVAAAGLTGGRINHFNITKQSKVRLHMRTCDPGSHASHSYQKCAPEHPARHAFHRGPHCTTEMHGFGFMLHRGVRSVPSVACCWLTCMPWSCFPLRSDQHCTLCLMILQLHLSRRGYIDRVKES